MEQYGKLNNGQLEVITYIDHGNSRTIGINSKTAQLFRLKEIVDVKPDFYNYEVSYTETETQIIVNYIEVVVAPEHWHEDTNFQIKFTTENLLDMIEAVPQMANYTNSLTTYRDMMHRIFYVNYFNEGERELIIYFGGIINEKD